MHYLCNPIPYYVYKIVCKPTGQYYFGSRYSHTKKGLQPCEDLWKTYFTSSSLVKDLIIIHGKDQFEPIILELFENKDLTYWYEQNLIKAHIKDELCINQCYKFGKDDRVTSMSNIGAYRWHNINTRETRYSVLKPGECWERGSGTTCYHKDGVTCYFFEDPGDGWIKGTGTNFYNKDGVTRRFFEDPGDGWVKGISCSYGFGNSYNKNKRWWNNGEKTLMSYTQPGPDWTRGRLPGAKQKKKSATRNTNIGEANRGKRAFNNGERTIMRNEHPGNGWVEGRLHNEGTCIKRSQARIGRPSNTLGKKWWNNGHLNKVSIEKPGPEWVQGKLK